MTLTDADRAAGLAAWNKAAHDPANMGDYLACINAAVLAGKLSGRAEAIADAARLRQLIADSARPHGTCDEAGSCTACRAKFELHKIAIAALAA